MILSVDDFADDSVGADEELSLDETEPTLDGAAEVAVPDSLDEAFDQLLKAEVIDADDVAVTGDDDIVVEDHPVADAQIDTEFSALLKDAETYAVGAPLAFDAAFERELAARVAIDTPLTHEEKPIGEKREFPLDTGPVWAPAGETTVITLSPQCYFHATKIVATDTSSNPGNGTRVTMINVGQKVQRMAAGGTLTAFFAANALGNGVDFDTDKPYSHIQITVSFIESCTFEMTLFGEAVI